MTEYIRLTNEITFWQAVVGVGLLIIFSPVFVGVNNGHIITSIGGSLIALVGVWNVGCLVYQRKHIPTNPVIDVEVIKPVN